VVVMTALLTPPQALLVRTPQTVARAL
jgi:hypothetical protein